MCQSACQSQHTPKATTSADDAASHHYASTNEQMDETSRAAWIESLRLSDCSINGRASGGTTNGHLTQQPVPADEPLRPPLSPSAFEIVTLFDDIDFGEPQQIESSDGAGSSTAGVRPADRDSECDSPFLAEIMTLFDEFDFGFQVATDDAVTSVNDPVPLAPMIRLNSSLEAIMECLPSPTIEAVTSQPVAEPQQQLREPCQHVQVAAPQVSWPVAQQAAHWPIQASQGPVWPLQQQQQLCRPSKREKLQKLQTRDFNSPIHTKVKEFVRVRSFTDVYADEDKEWIGKRVVLKKGKYAGRGALVKSRANKKYRVMVDGLEHQIEFYCTTFAHASST